MGKSIKHSRQRSQFWRQVTLSTQSFSNRPQAFPVLLAAETNSIRTGKTEIEGLNLPVDFPLVNFLFDPKKCESKMHY